MRRVGDLDEIKAAPLGEAQADTEDSAKVVCYCTFRPFTKPLLPPSQVVD